MSKKEDIGSLIHAINRAIKTANDLELDLKVATEASSVTISTLGFNSIFGLSVESLEELKKSLELNLSALNIASKR